MTRRTRQIRQTLEQHYLGRALEFRDHVAESVWTIVIAQLLELEKRMDDCLAGAYVQALERRHVRQAEDAVGRATRAVADRMDRLTRAAASVEQALGANEGLKEAWSDAAVGKDAGGAQVSEPAVSGPGPRAGVS